jgi:uncharacterized protein YacL
MDSIYSLVLISIGLIFVLIYIGSRLSKLKANVFFIGTFAVIVGLLIGTLAYLPLSKLPGIFGTWIPIIFYLLAVITSVWLFLARRKTIEQTIETAKKIIDTISHIKPPNVMPPTLSRGKKEEQEIVVDTSVLIDGRIADIVKTGFLQHRFLIPRFILAELQNIADSEDPMRRAKGRRGLDVLQELKNTPHLKVQTLTVEIPEHDKVDAKLVHFAKLRGADVLTTDYNLNKVAKIEGVKVLNINELSQALRPVIIPGEEMELKVVQPGKERNQGVGYLPDGTMIVVEEGDKLVGRTVKVEIKRVLQTAAGKMFFAIIKNGNGQKEKK